MSELINSDVRTVNSDLRTVNEDGPYLEAFEKPVRLMDKQPLGVGIGTTPVTPMFEQVEPSQFDGHFVDGGHDDIISEKAAKELTDAPGGALVTAKDAKQGEKAVKDAVADIAKETPVDTPVKDMSDDSSPQSDETPGIFATSHSPITKTAAEKKADKQAKARATDAEGDGLDS